MAPVTSVFEVIANTERLCQLMPMLNHISLYQSEEGWHRQCDFGNDMIVEERIVLWQPPSAYAYATIAPNPFGLWHHYALVTCQPHMDGTLHGTYLRWQHYFEHDDLGAMLSILNTMFEHLFTGLFELFGGHILHESNKNNFFSKVESVAGLGA